MKLFFIFLLQGITAQKQCTSHADCQFAGAGALCDFSTSSQEGLCKAIDGTFPVEPPTSSCNGTITTACPFGQTCIDGFCTVETQSFFTPTIIGLIIGGGALCLSILLLMACCFNELCCFSSKRGQSAPAALQQANKPEKIESELENIETVSRHIEQIRQTPRMANRPVPPGLVLIGGSKESDDKLNQTPDIEYSQPSVYRQNLSFSPDPKSPIEIVQLIPLSGPRNIVSQNPYSNIPLHFASSATMESPHQPEFKLKHDSKRLSQMSDIVLNRRDSASLVYRNPGGNQSESELISPPMDPGFFGFWDSYGRYHQGYRDENLRIHGGVFDDQEFFHFGKFGSSEPVTVEDEMMVHEIDESRLLSPRMGCQIKNGPTMMNGIQNNLSQIESQSGEQSKQNLSAPLGSRDLVSVVTTADATPTGSI